MTVMSYTVEVKHTTHIAIWLCIYYLCCQTNVGNCSPFKEFVKEKLTKEFQQNSQLLNPIFVWEDETSSPVTVSCMQEGGHLPEGSSHKWYTADGKPLTDGTSDSIFSDDPKNGALIMNNVKNGDSQRFLCKANIAGRDVTFAHDVVVLHMPTFIQDTVYHLRERSCMLDELTSLLTSLVMSEICPRKQCFGNFTIIHDTACLSTKAVYRLSVDSGDFDYRNCDSGQCLQTAVGDGFDDRLRVHGELRPEFVTEVFRKETKRTRNVTEIDSIVPPATSHYTGICPVGFMLYLSITCLPCLPTTRAVVQWFETPTCSACPLGTTNKGFSQPECVDTALQPIEYRAQAVREADGKVDETKAKDSSGMYMQYGAGVSDTFTEYWLSLCDSLVVMWRKKTVRIVVYISAAVILLVIIFLVWYEYFAKKTPPANPETQALASQMYSPYGYPQYSTVGVPPPQYPAVVVPPPRQLR